MYVFFIVFAFAVILVLCAFFFGADIRVFFFLKRHGFSKKLVTDEILFDMSLPDGKRGQDMFRTWLLPPEKNPAEKSVIVIDAGGTNFRSCLVRFDSDGNASVSDFRKDFMPAVDREYSKEEFFSAIADKIGYLKDKSDRIGFCFSYALEMTKDHDGIPNAFSKEIKAKEVLGCPVGKSLFDELKKRGWTKLKKVNVVNDTVSALLAGCAVRQKTDFSSFIGFIYGTGINAAFIDEENSFGGGRQIIVCENGKCDKIRLSDFDTEVDKKTDIPGQYPLEKCCSGAYLGKVGLQMLKTAANENLFSKKAARKILAVKDFSTVELNEYLLNCAAHRKKFSSSDCRTAFRLLDSAVERGAAFGASIVGAALVSCKKGTSPEEKVCVVCNGTTLEKTYRLKERFEKSLHKITAKKKINFSLCKIENDITLGTAVAGTV